MLLYLKQHDLEWERCKHWWTNGLIRNWNLGKDRHGVMRLNFDDQVVDQWSEPTLQKGEVSKATQRMALECYLGD